MTVKTFQSTLSVRRATASAANAIESSRFQSTLSVRRATARLDIARDRGQRISIHALREESDRALPLFTAMNVGFQSTLSVRRATCALVVMILSAKFQSTLSVRRATRGNVMQNGAVRISIHALREESDILAPTITRFTTFQSTLSVRRATISTLIIA